MFFSSILATAEEITKREIFVHMAVNINILKTASSAITKEILPISLSTFSICINMDADSVKIFLFQKTIK